MTADTGLEAAPEPDRLYAGGVPGIAVEIVIGAPASFVWKQLQDIDSHTEWMADAVAIRFLSSHQSGVGTRFECDTKVGPIKLTDIMEITEWIEPKTMGVTHQGIVSGSGVFDLRASGSTTVFSWVETLSFPWYLGGPVGAIVSRPILKSIWTKNLRRLKSQVEDRYAITRQQEMLND